VLSKEVVRMLETRLERKNDRKVSVILGRIIGSLLTGIVLATLMYL
jgi:hypothetical protein